ncbi:rRNA maturation RNase YbeY [Rhodothermus marinus]|uniref:rRNA maturation RNase YbeY n=1 Tax=Rhodothermus marinus TaxID=29549 RepID=UPI0006D2461D|nr:rRNA maturation RNase YbeY [Rhodothermus marinus]
MKAPETEALEIVQAHPSRRLPNALLRRLVQAVLAGEKARLRYLSLVLADHATVRELNRTYLGHDYDTDVLSFPLSEKPGVVEGEIYVDLDTAAERHAEFGATFTQEACRYVVHGLLHLLGYDDATPEARAHMHRLEDRYLQAAGLL